MTPDTTRAAMKTGNAPTAIRKEIVAQIEAGDSGPVRFTLSTATPDRVGDTIAVSGWDLAQYRQNPVVLFAHDASRPPVGMSLREWIEGDALHGEVQFASKEYDFAATIEKLVRGKYLRAVSVGFRALEYKFNEARGDWAVDFLKQELLEYSVVPIPANPEALAHAKGSGIDLRPLAGWAERVLDGVEGKGFWVARDTLEKTWRAAAGSRVVTFGAKADEDPPALPADTESDDEESGEASPMVCKGCGAEFDEGDKFCAQCGEPIEKADPPADPPPEDAKAFDWRAAIAEGVTLGMQR